MIAGCTHPFAIEAAVRTALEGEGLRVTRPLVIDTAKSGKGALGERHLGVLRAARADRGVAPIRATVPPADVLVEPAVNGRSVTLHTVFSLFSRPNELIVQPFAADESAYLAAKRSGRSILAVAESEEVWKAGRGRIEELLNRDGEKGGGR